MTPFISLSHKRMLLPRVVKRLVFSLKVCDNNDSLSGLIITCIIKNSATHNLIIHTFMCCSFTYRAAFFLWAVIIFVSLSYYFSVTTHVRAFIPNINCLFSLSFAFTVTIFLNSLLLPGLLIFLLLLPFFVALFLFCALSFGDWQLGFYQCRVSWEESQAMAARSVYSSSVSSLPPPSPKSPPEYPDLYGKRREIANIQTLEREIGFLEVSLNLKMIISVYIISSPSSYVSPLWSSMA